MVISEKYCWYCKKQLDFEEFKQINSTLNEYKLIKFWNHPFLQYFCCNCYTKLIRRDVKKLLSDQNEYKKALHLNHNPALWRRLAIIFYHRGDYQRTREAYKRILDLDPSDHNSIKNFRKISRELKQIKN